jgi:peptidyl-prolyl cis-trans isomerase B (cyclophilin B)
MMLASALLSAAAFAGGPKVQWQAPTAFIPGGSYRVHVEVTAPEAETAIAGWLLTPAAFNVDGNPLTEREDKGSMRVPAGTRLMLDLDLGPYLRVDKDFKLTYAKEIAEGGPVAVKIMKPAPPGLSFMDERSVPTPELAKYNVVLQTTRGDMVLEFWPDVAPSHVRNFLDLAYTGFYDGIIFHRCWPGFMIQAGNRATKEDVDATAELDGPRRVRAEFNQKKHERGVLSMARTDDPNSASSQFFIMHATNSQLDGKYSAFGKLVSGYETLDAIANAPGRPISGAGGNRPTDPQRILKAIVVGGSK